MSKDLDNMIEKLKRCELLPENEVINLCMKASELLRQEPNIVQILPPVTICGDIHGQFYDLLELFAVAGELPETNYLFLGDYVDRGRHSIETFLLLLSLKLRYPSRMTLIRGNHESRNITMTYGFYDECHKKYGSATVWQCCTDLFDTMPIAAMIGGRILCIHGGLSPKIHTINDISLINREMEIPLQGALADIMWSDPAQGSENGWNASPRGAGFVFGRDVAEKFVNANELDFVIRAHQLVQEGYLWHFSRILLTIWSAPNYCYRCGNAAAVLQLDEKLSKSFLVFDAAPNQVYPEHTPFQDDYFL